MKSQKIISILIFLAIILSMFGFGYLYSKINQNNIKQNEEMGIKWCFNSNNVESNVNLSNQKIAPGSNGSFVIEIDASKAETDMKYEIKIMDQKNIPENLKYSAIVKNKNDEILLETEEYNSLSELLENLEGTISVNEQNKERLIEIYWNWEFNDEINEIFINPDNSSATLDSYYSIEIIGEQV